MPIHIVKDPQPRSKKPKPKNWHPWLKEEKRRNRVAQMELKAKMLAVNAVIESEDEEEDLD